MIRYILPIWVSMIINTLLSLTDMFFLKQIDTDYVTAVGIAIVPYMLLSIMLTGLGIAANRYTAGGKSFNVFKIITICSVTSLLICIVCNGISHILFLYANQSVREYVLEYFNIYIYTLIPLGIMYIATGILRGNNRSSISVIFNTLAVITNGILDWIFIKNVYKEKSCFGCGLASLLSDSLIATIYIVLLLSFYKKKDTYVGLKEFIISSCKFSLEKLFSTASIMIISSVFISFLDIDSSNVYFGTEKMFSPIRMFSYSYFEWVIFSESKSIKRNIYQSSAIMIGLCIIMAFISALYFDTNMTQILFIILFAASEVIFSYEREQVAIAFSGELTDDANRVMFIKSIVLISLMFILTMTKTISLISLGVVQVMVTFFSVYFLKKSVNSIYIINNKQLD